MTKEELTQLNRLIDMGAEKLSYKATQDEIVRGVCFNDGINYAKYILKNYFEGKFDKSLMED